MTTRIHSVLVLSACLATGPLTAFAQSNSNDRIIGGTTVAATDTISQSIVGVQITGFLGITMGTCTGSLLDTDLVITAAHCVQDGAKNLRVVFGNTLKTPLKITVDGVIANPLYDPNGDGTNPDENDVAIIHFKGGLPPGYQKATVLQDVSLLQKGVTTTLAGYGINKASPQSGDGILRKVDVTIYDTTYAKSEIVLDQTQGHGACHGDSGGPAYITVDGKLQLWGITDRGYPATAPDDCAHYSVYTSIPAFSDFIAQSAITLRKGQ